MLIFCWPPVRGGYVAAFDNKIARPVAGVELRENDLVHAESAGVGRTRQHEKMSGAVGGNAASARDWMVEVPISAYESMRNSSLEAGMDLVMKGLAAPA